MHVSQNKQGSLWGSYSHVRVQVGQYGVTDEILGLKRDKNILMLELLRQRQQQKVNSE